MKTLINSLFFALAFSAVTMVSTVSASAGTPKQPQRAVTYQVGVYGSLDGSKLNVSVDKQLGGRVEIVFKDAKGQVLFHQSMRKTDEKYRGKLDVSSLVAGDYKLEVTNGQETTVRPLTIQTKLPAEPTRIIALL